MSSEKRKTEARRWLQTAQEDLEIARILFDKTKYSSSCFHAQQAGEKALKSICYLHGTDPWGHSLVNLLDELGRGKRISEELLALRKDAMLLDRFYIPTRYPDGLPDKTPMEAFCDSDAQTAMEKASHFVGVAKTVIKESKDQ